MHRTTLIATLLAAAVAASAPQAFGLGYDQVYSFDTQVEMQAGESRLMTLRVTSPVATGVAFEVRGGDALMPQLSPQSAQMQAGGTLDVEMTVTVPDGADTGTTYTASLYATPTAPGQAGVFREFTITVVGAPATPAEIETVRVGVLVPQTGSLASLGDPAEAAIDKGLADLNTRFTDTDSKWQLQLDKRDTESTPAKALEELRGMNERGTKVVLGPLSSSELAGVRQYAGDNGMLLLSCCSVSSALALEDNVFRFLSPTANQGEFFVGRLAGQGVQTVVVAYRDGDPWGMSLLESVRGSASGMTVVPVTYDPAAIVALGSGTPVTSDIASAVSGNTAVLLASYQNDGDLIVGAAAANARLAGLEWYGSQFWPTVSDGVSQFVTQRFTVIDDAPDRGHGSFQTVTQDLQRRLSITDPLERVYSGAYAAYDSVQILGKAIVLSDSTRVTGDGGLGDSVPAAALGHRGLMGSTQLDANGDLATAAYETLEYVNGRWQVSYTTQTAPNAAPAERVTLDVTAPPQRATPSGGGGGGGGGGGSARVSGTTLDGGAVTEAVYIRSASWDCEANTIIVVAGPSSGSLDVTLRMPVAGVVRMTQSGDSAEYTEFTAPFGSSESFARISATLVSNRTIASDTESVNIDSCTGTRTFDVPEPRATSQPFEVQEPERQQAERQEPAEQTAPPAEPVVEPAAPVAEPPEDPAPPAPEPPAPITQEPVTQEPITDEPDAEPVCGPGTFLADDGTCTPVPTDEGGGCLIATAAYGTEMAEQVQKLREIRDGALSTGPGSAFMSGFNQFYYAFSPAVADLERSSPAFKEAVRISLQPLLLSLGAMQFAESEAQTVLLGSLVILFNASLIGSPAAAAIVYRRLRR